MKSAGFSSRLKELREAQGLSASELAKKIGLRPSSISRIENGDTKAPTKETISKIASGLNISIEELVPKENHEDGKTELVVGVINCALSAPALLANFLDNESKPARFVNFVSLPDDSLGRGKALHDTGSVDRSGAFVQNIPYLKNYLKDRVVIDEANDHLCTAPDWADWSEMVAFNLRNNTQNLEVNGDYQLSAGKQVIDMWAKHEIDVAVASKSLFTQSALLPSLTDAFHIARISESKFALSLITLIDPREISSMTGFSPSAATKHYKFWRYNFKSLLKMSLMLGTFAKVRYQKNIGKLENIDLDDFSLFKGSPNDSSEIDLSLIYEKFDESDKLKWHIYYPNKTFAEIQMRSLRGVTQSDQALIKNTIVAHPTPDIGDYCQFRDSLFRELTGSAHQSGAGQLTVALWEPYATYIRHDWEQLVRRNIYKTKEWPGENVKNCYEAWLHESENSKLNHKTFFASFEKSLGHVLSDFGVPSFPSVSMDVFVRKSLLEDSLSDYLNSPLAKTLELIKLSTAAISNSISPHPINIDKYSDDWAYILQRLLFGDFDFGSFRTSENILSLNMGENKDIVSMQRTVNALEAIDFEFNYTNNFVDMILSNNFQV